MSTNLPVARNDFSNCHSEIIFVHKWMLVLVVPNRHEYENDMELRQAVTPFRPMGGPLIPHARAQLSYRKCCRFKMNELGWCHVFCLGSFDSAFKGVYPLSDRDNVLIPGACGWILFGMHKRQSSHEHHFIAYVKFYAQDKTLKLRPFPVSS